MRTGALVKVAAAAGCVAAAALPAPAPGAVATVAVGNFLKFDPASVTPAAPVTQQGSSPVCVSKRNFRIRIRQPRGTRITAASVVVNGRPVAVTARDGRFTAPVDLRGLPRGQHEVAITARDARGRTLRGKRVYRTCDAKLASAALPAL